MDDAIKFYIDEKTAGLRCRKFLEREGLSRKLIVSSFNENRIFINDKLATRGVILKTGDIVYLTFANESINIPPAPLRQEILYEDMDLLVVNKGRHVPIMPCKMYPNKTFANEVAGYFQSIGLHRKIRLVGRLDIHTTGVMMVAKNPYVLGQLNHQHTKNKVYYALVAGKIEKPMTIDAPIIMPTYTMVRTVGEGGLRAITHIEPVSYAQDTSLIRIKLETGRTHQIRTHLQYIGHPLLGDELYGGPIDQYQVPMLHVYKLSIFHPRKKEKISFTADLPLEMKNFIEV